MVYEPVYRLHGLQTACGPWSIKRGSKFFSYGPPCPIRREARQEAMAEAMMAKDNGGSNGSGDEGNGTARAKPLSMEFDGKDGDGNERRQRWQGRRWGQRRLRQLQWQRWKRQQQWRWGTHGEGFLLHEAPHSVKGRWGRQGTKPKWWSMRREPREGEDGAGEVICTEKWSRDDSGGFGLPPSFFCFVFFFVLTSLNWVGGNKRKRRGSAVARVVEGREMQQQGCGALIPC